MTILSDEYYQTKGVLMRRMGVGVSSIDRYIRENYDNLTFVYISDGATGRAKLAIKKKKGVEEKGALRKTQYGYENVEE